jgi:hypothetical protein
VSRQRTGSLVLLEARELVVSVDCPAAPRGCGKPAGELCVNPRTGQPFLGLGHHARITLAERTHPDPNRPPAVPPEQGAVAPSPRLIAVSKMRLDLAAHRKPCEHCQRPIVWAVNRRGDSIPVDAQPSDSGMWLLTPEPNGTILATTLRAGQTAEARRHNQSLHHPHRASCPKRMVWSRVVRGDHGRGSSRRPR